MPLRPRLGDVEGINLLPVVEDCTSAARPARFSCLTGVEISVHNAGGMRRGMSLLNRSAIRPVVLMVEPSFLKAAFSSLLQPAPRYASLHIMFHGRPMSRHRLPCQVAAPPEEPGCRHCSVKPPRSFMFIWCFSVFRRDPGGFECSWTLVSRGVGSGEWMGRRRGDGGRRGPCLNGLPTVVKSTTLNCLPQQSAHCSGSWEEWWGFRQQRGRLGVRRRGGRPSMRITVQAE